MNILFINANLYGHINPTLGLVKKLTEKGHQVSYYCAEPFMEQVKKMGADWIGYSEKLNLFLKSYRPTDRHPFYMLMEYMLLYDEAALPEILDLVNEGSYDMILCDSYFGGACFLKQIVDLPVVCSHSSFAMSHTPVPPRMLVPGFHPQLDHCFQVLKRICEQYQIEEPTMEQVFTSVGDRNIVYTTCSFNADEGVKEPEYLFNGPSMDRLQEAADLDLFVAGERKLLYISLGSVNTDFVEFYKMCIEAFRNTDYYVVLSIGWKCEVSQLGDLPDNFMVRNFLPQLKVLQRADAFITHAGFNSVNEALSFGVPMLALPLVNDQHMVAKRLVSMQLGMSENMKELTAEQLRARTEELMKNDSIRDHCRRMSQDMKESAQLEQTVQKLEEYAKNRIGRKHDGVNE